MPAVAHSCGPGMYGRREPDRYGDKAESGPPLDKAQPFLGRFDPKVAPKESDLLAEQSVRGPLTSQEPPPADLPCPELSATACDDQHSPAARAGHAWKAVEHQSEPPEEAPA